MDLKKNKAANADGNLLERIEAVRQERQRQNLEKLLGELNEMIGLDQVKNEINSLVNLIEITKMRSEKGLPSMDMSYHMVFTGNPGTGKTTIARLVAGIYKELGVLSAGTLTETDRAGLVAGFVGQTALKVKDVCKKASGGVLFIDEAYSLTQSTSSSDFGLEAVDTLVKEMEDNRGNLVVIAAGYTNEMRRFISANTGLMSRFNKIIEFPDYSEEELIDILRLMAKRAGYQLTAEAVMVIKCYVEEMTPNEARDFGNARGIRNLFERMVTNQANRLMSQKGVRSVKALTFITRDDAMLAVKENIASHGWNLL